MDNKSDILFSLIVTNSLQRFPYLCHCAPFEFNFHQKFGALYLTQLWWYDISLNLKTTISHTASDWLYWHSLFFMKLVSFYLRSGRLIWKAHLCWYTLYLTKKPPMRWLVLSTETGPEILKSTLKELCPLNCINAIYSKFNILRQTHNLQVKISRC